MIISRFRDFLRDEHGAVTVDWVVLTAAIVGLGLAVIVLVADGATDLSAGVGANLTNMEIMQHGSN